MAARQLSARGAKRMSPTPPELPTSDRQPPRSHPTTAAVQVLLALVLLAGCGKSSSPTSPSPSSTASGVWTGTLTRPGGAAAMSARWQATEEGGGQLRGPFTLTND